MVATPPKKNRPLRLQFLGRLRCVGIAGDARGHGDQIKESGCRGRQAFFGVNRCIPKNRWRPKKQQWLIEFNYVYVSSVQIHNMHVYIYVIIYINKNNNNNNNSNNSIYIYVYICVCVRVHVDICGWMYIYTYRSVYCFWCMGNVEETTTYRNCFGGEGKNVTLGFTGHQSQL